MKVVAVIVAFAALAAATPLYNADTNAMNERVVESNSNLYLSGNAPQTKKGDGGSANSCVACAEYCSEGGNGSAVQHLCYIVKCGLTVKIYLGCRCRRKCVANS